MQDDDHIKDDDFSGFTDDDRDNVKPIDAPDAFAEPAFPPLPGAATPPAPPRGPSALPGQDVPLPEYDFGEKPAREVRKPRRAAEGVRQDLMDDEEDRSRNFLQKGEIVDLTAKEPTLRRILVGAGWDQRAYEEERIDVDLSVFLLNKDDKTRVDEDFVFYNNLSALDLAVKHLGDNRTGAGDGDDEVIEIDLNGLPFDILKVMFVLSVYDPEILGYNFSHIKNAFLRIVNKDQEQELVRVVVPEEDLGENTAIYMASLNREGPSWFFEGVVRPTKNGLAKIASDYDIVVRELQSTGLQDDAGEVAEARKRDEARNSHLS
jgi:tellurium resistance protein TerD